MGRSRVDAYGRRCRGHARRLTSRKNPLARRTKQSRDAHSVQRDHCRAIEALKAGIVGVLCFEQPKATATVLGRLKWVRRPYILLSGWWLVVAIASGEDGADDGVADSLRKDYPEELGHEMSLPTSAVVGVVRVGTPRIDAGVSVHPLWMPLPFPSPVPCTGLSDEWTGKRWFEHASCSDGRPRATARLVAQSIRESERVLHTLARPHT